MEKREIILYWLQSADQDYDTMKFLFKNNRFVHALFFGHLFWKNYVRPFG